MSPTKSRGRSPAADAAGALQRIQQAMQAGAFEQALAECDALLTSDPDDIDTRYMKAVCQRYLKRHDAALATLEDLLFLAPDFGRAIQEEGHVFRDLGQNEQALRRYRTAVAVNPGLHASWAGQSRLLYGAGRADEARQAQAQADRLRALPATLLAATNHLYENRLLNAEALCRRWLQQYPRDVEAMRLLAEIGNRLGVLEDAEFLLESAVSFAPDNAPARIDYIRILRKRQKHGRALEEAEALIARDRVNPVAQSQLAIQKMQLGDYQGALALFDDVLEAVPGDPATLTSIGHALKTWGRSEDAVTSYREALKSAPAHGDAWYALANLKTYRFTDQEIAAMSEAEGAEGQPVTNRINLCFALGKAHEDRGDYKISFGFYERGNALKKRQSRYTSEQMDEEFAAQREFCTRSLFDKQAGKGEPAHDPIFIVGLPRAGSTLLEQILASHSMVEGTLELPNIIATSQRLRGRDRLSDRTRYPRILHELDQETLRALGRRYLDETAIHRRGAPRFTDKMPNNFRHIGLIKLILPNAKIIDARRDPLGCCFSGFKQLFAEGQEFTYGLEEIGRYYRGYLDLMDHWDDVLPGQVHRVIYEDMVTDTENQIRRLLDFCGLPFEEACLDFHKTRRDVRTASSEQVRQPINTRGLDAWKPFEAWLGPLKEALGPALDSYRREGR